MELPKIYKNSSEEVKSIIINLGSSVYSHILNEMNEEEILMKYKIVNNNDIKEFYNKQIEEKNNEKIEIINTYNKKIHELDDTYTLRIQKETERINNDNQNLRDQINQFQNNMHEKEKNLYKVFEKQYEEKMEQLRMIHSLQIEKKDEKIHGMENEMEIHNTKVEPLLHKITEKKDFANTTEQGDYGEKFIDELVGPGLPFDSDAYIDDTHKVSGSGDRILRFKNGFVLMIEVKNEKTIDKGDREQFQEHSRKDFQEKKCDCSLFLSLRQQKIPRIAKTFRPEYDKDDSRMVYYGLDDELTLIEKKHRILACIEELYDKFKRNNDLINENIPQKNAMICNQHLEMLNNQKNDYEALIKEGDRNIQTYRKKLLEINKKINLCVKEHGDYLDIKLIDEKTYKKDLIDRIKQWKEGKNIILKNTFRQKIADEMNLSELDKTMLKKIKLNDIN